MSRRSQEELTAQYGRLCQKAGNLNYQIVAIQKDLDLVNEQLLELNLEAAANNKADQEAASAAAEAAATPVVSEPVALES